MSLDRRSIIKSLAGVFCGIFSRNAIGSNPRTIPAELFDWTCSPPSTTYQRFMPLGRGEGVAPDITIDAEPVAWEEPVMRCMTGDSGWVEFGLWDEFKREMSAHCERYPFKTFDKNGNETSPPGPTLRRYRRHGRVEVFLPKKSSGS